MEKLKAKLIELVRDEEGLTTVEYAIAGSLVGLAVVQAFTDLGTQVGTTIYGLEEAIGGGGAPAP